MTDKRFRLTYTPALDGMRGLAILCVLASHAGLSLYGGSLVMFVLSGFLISSLLFKEYQRTGSIHLLNFYGRRFRRLIPALLAMLIVVNLLVAALVPHQATALRTDTGYALVYASNWQQVWQIPSTLYLSHLWSLSIEEQFYILWPMACLTLFRLPMRYAAVVCGVVAIASWMARVLLMAEGMPMTTYAFATFARLDGLMLGGALALMLHTAAYGSLVRLVQRMPHIASAITLSAACVLGVCLCVYAARMLETYSIGMPLVSLCVCVLIAACVLPQQSLVTRLLSSRILVHVGLISYGVYLWHWPILVLMREGGVENAGVWSAALGLMAAQLSYTWIEKPMRKGHGVPLTNITPSK